MQNQDSSDDKRADDSVALPAFSPDGVDLTLIRWMLQMTPAQRLHVLQSGARSLKKLRDAVTRTGT
jgi:hypothetical protein